MGDPEVEIACAEVVAEWYRKPGSSSQARAYDRELRSVTPRLLRAKATLSSEDVFIRTTVTVQLFSAGSWVDVASLSTHEYDYSPPTGDPPELFPIEITVLPAPGSLPPSAAILVTGYDASPGMGHKGAHIQWAKLPASFSYDGPNVIAGRHSVTAIPLGDQKPGQMDAKARARPLNTLGFRRHVRGDYRSAERLFASAVRLDPGYLLARYNLACALARLGYAERALGQLQEVFRTAGDRIEERRRQARIDPDFAGLRKRPDFRKLVEPGQVAP